MKETWKKSSGPFHIQRLADHYEVFRDLFPMAYFLPQVSLLICYSQDNGGQVHYGNRLTPTEVGWRNCFFIDILVVKVNQSSTIFCPFLRLHFLPCTTNLFFCVFTVLILSLFALCNLYMFSLTVFFAIPVSLQAASVPQISFDAEEGSLWTLLLTCPGQHQCSQEAPVHYVLIIF